MAPPEADRAFAGSIPQFYERYLVPLIFEPYAADLASRVARRVPSCVLEVAAVAQQDENSGEVVALFVVKKDPNLTAEALIAFCRTELTGYKVPRHVYFRTELPKTNVGKILRRALRDELRGAVPA